MSAPSSNSTKRGDNYPALNGLRFLAAMFVVVFHCAYKLENYERAPALVHKLVDDGPAAVGFFFILSGFLLATRHVRRSGLPTESSAEFYWARFIRLYPAYLVGFFLFLPFVWFVSFVVLLWFLPNTGLDLLCVPSVAEKSWTLLKHIRVRSQMLPLVQSHIHPWA